MSAPADAAKETAPEGPPSDTTMEKVKKEDNGLRNGDPPKGMTPKDGSPPSDTTMDKMEKEEKGLSNGDPPKSTTPQDVKIEAPKHASCHDEKSEKPARMCFIPL